MRDADSLLNHYKELIALRKDCPGLALGKYETADTSGNHQILAYTITYGDDVYLIMHNLDDAEQAATIPLLEGVKEQLWNEGGMDSLGNEITLTGHASAVFSL